MIWLKKRLLGHLPEAQHPGQNYCWSQVPADFLSGSTRCFFRMSIPLQRKDQLNDLFDEFPACGASVPPLSRITPDDLAAYRCSGARTTTSASPSTSSNCREGLSRLPSRTHITIPAQNANVDHRYSANPSRAPGFPPVPSYELIQETPLVP